MARVFGDSYNALSSSSVGQCNSAPNRKLNCLGPKTGKMEWSERLFTLLYLLETPIASLGCLKIASRFWPDYIFSTLIHVPEIYSASRVGQLRLNAPRRSCSP